MDQKRRVVWCFQFCKWHTKHLWGVKCQPDKNKTQYTWGMTGCKFPEPQNGIRQPSEADRSLSGLHAYLASLFPVSCCPLSYWGPWVWWLIPWRSTGRLKRRGGSQSQPNPEPKPTLSTGVVFQPGHWVCANKSQHSPVASKAQMSKYYNRASPSQEGQLPTEMSGCSTQKWWASNYYNTRSGLKRTDTFTRLLNEYTIPPSLSGV